ncbi:MAG: 4-hydroxy-tetrahydrodipicolinate synthase [Clostridia bacterium]|nr:4-hydroxy-tetrahydrodipicolinate synthase [Clostridia bacterium]
MSHKTAPFYGVCTALVTPMTKDGVDYGTLKELIDWQIEQNVDALLICGTTGEASTLSSKERQEVVARGIEMVDGRVPVIVGCGTNATTTTMAWCHHATACGADGVLVITPYYNKGTQNGIVKHFLTVADTLTLPMILYHVPSRTGVTLNAKQIDEMANHPRIVAIKEADTSIDRLADEMAVAGDRLHFYAGNDSLAIPTLSMGGIGLISVISNILPQEMGDILRLYQQGKTTESLTLARKLLPLVRLLFLDTNPAPIKYALHQCGFGTGYLRLPLAEIDEGLKKKICEELALL